MKKRSITIAGHRTSLSLEDAFWDELKRLASERGQTLTALVTEIDNGRDLKTNLCSALRLFVLDSFKDKQT